MENSAWSTRPTWREKKVLRPWKPAILSREEGIAQEALPNYYMTLMNIGYRCHGVYYIRKDVRVTGKLSEHLAGAER